VHHCVRPNPITCFSIPIWQCTRHQHDKRHTKPTTAPLQYTKPPTQQTTTCLHSATTAQRRRRPQCRQNGVKADCKAVLLSPHPMHNVSAHTHTHTNTQAWTHQVGLEELPPRGKNVVHLDQGNEASTRGRLPRHLHKVVRGLASGILFITHTQTHISQRMCDMRMGARMCVLRVGAGVKEQGQCNQAICEHMSFDTY